MENNLKVFKNVEFGEIDILIQDGKEYFPATETARILGYKNPQEAIRLHCKGVREMLTPSKGGKQLKKYIQEGDLFRLIIKSKLPSAEKFERWVFDEVLPTIRKHGIYAIDEIINNPDVMIKALEALKVEKEKSSALEKKIKDDRPKTIFADAVSVSESCILVGDLAKLINQNGYDMGAKRLFEWLRENGYLIKRKGIDYNMPTQRAMNMGLFEISETVITNSDGRISVRRTPKVTGDGSIYFINKFLSYEN